MANQHTTQTITPDPGCSLPRSIKTPSSLSITLLLLAGMLLAGGQMLVAGYRLGVGNQSIQVPFVYRSIDADAFPRDAMVNETMRDYPSYFFRGLAKIVSAYGLPQTYFVLNLATAFALLAAVWLLAISMFDDPWVALVAMALLAAGHHQALAGDDLYSPGFTHTWAVFPPAILAIALLYRGRTFAAFALAGLLFNLHALTAAYLLVMFCACQLRRPNLASLAACIGVFAILASPTLLTMAHAHQSFDAQWLRLMRIRSAEHSFPSSWWDSGRPDIPRFLLLVALATLSLSFQMKPATRRTSLLLAAGVGMLFFLGYLLTDVWPTPVVIRAQLFRSSRLLMMILFCQIACGIVRGFRAHRIEAIGAGFTLLVLAVPPLLPLLPVAAALATIIALLNGRLSAAQAAFVGLVAVVCIMAHQSIGFDLLGWRAISISLGSGTMLGTIAALIALGAAGLALRPANVILRTSTLALVVILTVAAIIQSHRLAIDAPPDAWARAQLWARDNTPKDALFLTPIEPGGFRVLSQRSVVGEWRDGTQMYFNADFAPHWWETMNALQPGMLFDAKGSRMLSRGQSLEQLTNEKIGDLCKRFGATHIVLPTASSHALPSVYSNEQWTIYQPTAASDALAATSPVTSRKSLPPHWPDFSWLTAATGLLEQTPAHDPPTSTTNPALDDLPPDTQDKFMLDVVGPNIEKNRKSDVSIEIIDAAGHPVAALPYEIHQTRLAFDLSCSLNFFSDPIPAGNSFGDFKPTVPVKPPELAKFLELFNSSVIPFSAKWLYIEPVQGQTNYADLDAYVDWCGKHNVDMEFHFLSGYAPGWVRSKTPVEQGALFLEHARDMAQRYGKKIKYWQVTNEHHLVESSPAVYAELHKLLPDAQLGLSDCAQFFAPHQLHPDPPQTIGLEDLRWLKKQGVKVDFFAIHGHRPFGIWPDPKVIYETLDLFAKEDVRLHISEFSCPMTKEIIGGYRTGKWTPALQAEFYAQYFTVLFSHPAVDMVNLWEIGPLSWQPDSGLLDEHGDPKPVFAALDDLFNHRWRTNLAGTTAADAPIQFHGFHGSYELSVKSNGRPIKTTFEVVPGKPAHLRFRLDPSAGTLTAQHDTN